jgi:DNA-binding transcriptional MerR regulator
MTDKEYSLEELASEYSARFPGDPVATRTLRYYISMGLLLGPGRVGPGKHYTETHMVLLETIRNMQKTGTSIEQIKEHIDSTKSGELLQQWAVQEDLAQSKRNATRSVLGKVGRIFESPREPHRTRSSTTNLNHMGIEGSKGLWQRLQVSDGVEILIQQDLVMEHQSELMKWIEEGASIFSDEGGA